MGLFGELDLLSTARLQELEELTVQLSADLIFRSAQENTTGGDGQGTGITLEELRKSKDNWYGELSGGQRCKVELIRQVFLRRKCPDVLLIDEVFGPLDPVSKGIVQRKLKQFCADSLILVIHHTDADDNCVSKGFFDDNIHFANGSAT